MRDMGPGVRKSLVWAATVGVLAASLWWTGLGRGGWQVPKAIDPALQLPSVNAEVFFLHVPRLVRAGPERLVVVRFGGPAQFVPYTYASAGLKAPQPIEAWAKVLPAPVLFNAGQFDHNRNHLGWLKAHHTWLSRQRKPAWMGLLVSGPQLPDHAAASGGGSPARPWAQVVDLAGGDVGAADAYAHVVQSMMLVDEGANVRVRRSNTAACRTVVAEDRAGRVLVIASEGAVTLHDLAAWLPVSGLQVVRAMNLDGGMESQLAVVTPQLQLMLYGQYGSDNRLLHVPQTTAARAPLPAVVAVFAGGR